MNYCTPEFLVFFGLVYAGYRLLLAHGRWPAAKGLLLAASYVFYAFWYYPYALLLLASTLVDFACGLGLGRARDLWQRRALLIVSLGTNLAILFCFKYLAFFVQAACRLLGLAGVGLDVPAWNILLPVGVSFYTFQTMSYTIDVYTGVSAPTRRFRDFALFISFFTQLVAGPVVRAREFLPQLVRPRRIRWAFIYWGGFLVILGCFKKMVLADNIAPYVDYFFQLEDYHLFHAHTCWLYLLAYAAQLYADFSGYSDIAIGLALLMGFRLPLNFYYPYLALGFRDFWRRWNISLSRWFRDYLYMPLSLAGRRSRKRGSSQLRQHWVALRSVVITMVLVGFWHGAGWQFLVFGLIQGVYLLIDHLLFRRLLERLAGAGARAATLGRGCVRLLTLLLMTYSFVFFRSGSFGQAWQITQAMFANWSPALASFQRNLYWIQYWGVVFALHLAVLLAGRHTTRRRFPKWVYFVTAQCMLLLILFNRGATTNAFIYFRF